MKRLLCLLLFVSNLVGAQSTPQTTYTQSVDKLNCAAVKMLLTAYSRPGIARGIQQCDLATLKTAVGKVQENQLKGYKQKILTLADDVHGYKNKAADLDTYADFESTFEELNRFILNRFRKMCEEDRQVQATVCPDLDKNILTLQGSLNEVTTQALAKIKQQLSGPATAAPATPRNTESVEQTPETTPDASLGNETTTAASGRSWTTIFLFLLIFGLMGAVFWLYKEQLEVKEQLEGLKTLVNMFNRQRQ